MAKLHMAHYAIMRAAKKNVIRRARVQRLSNSPAVICLLLFAFCLPFGACKENKGGPVAASASNGHCPVCMMSVKSSDRFASEIFYSDGTKLMFETTGDMLTFYSAPEQCDRVPDSHKNRENIEKMVVKDYNAKTTMEAREATLVYKSSVSGPMGPDIFAFGKPEEARSFSAQHGGEVVTFDEVTPEMVSNLRKK